MILVKEGEIRAGQKIRSFNNQKEYHVFEVGLMYPEMQQVEVRLRKQNLLQQIFRCSTLGKLAI